MSPLRNGGPEALARIVKVLAWGVPSHTMGWSVPLGDLALHGLGQRRVSHREARIHPERSTGDLHRNHDHDNRACSVPVAPTVMTTSSCARAPSGVRATSADTYA